MIRHVLADGRELDNIEGFVIPPTGAATAVYCIVAESMQKRLESKEGHKEDKKDATA